MSGPASSHPPQVRPARIDDYEAYAALFPELAVEEPVPTRERFDALLRPRMLVACDPDSVVGYALFELLDQVGYVRNVVTAPEHRRHGVGRALMDHLRAHFLACGATSWCLNVRSTNTPAVGLYEAAGMSTAYASSTVRVAPDSPAWPLQHPLEIAEVAPSDEAALEARFSLPHGQLCSAREKRGMRVMSFVSKAPVGVAALDPRFAGAFPFRVVSPELGPTAFQQLRSLCAPEAPWFQVVVEGDTELEDALVRAGARVTDRFVHMRGAL